MQPCRAPARLLAWCCLLSAVLLLPRRSGAALNELHDAQHATHLQLRRHGVHIIADGGRTTHATGAAGRPRCPETPSNRSSTFNMHQGRMHIMDFSEPGQAQLLLSFTPTNYHYGNELSTYWQARRLAELGGMDFLTTPGFDRDWLQYLPKMVPRTGCGSEAAYEMAVQNCDWRDAWPFPHRCVPDMWGPMRAVIQEDSHAALEAWAAYHGAALPSFQPGDVVVQLRCAADTLLSHGEYGPAPFSFYRHIPPEAPSVTIVADTNNEHEPCRKLLAGLQAHLEGRFPGRVRLYDGETWEDWATLMLAPVLFKDTTTFGLWAALGNRGEVFSPPLPHAYMNRTPDLGPTWTWVDVDVLFPGTGQREGLSLADMDGVLRWLASH